MTVTVPTRIVVLGRRTWEGERFPETEKIVVENGAILYSPIK